MIKAIVQACEHIVHVDPIPETNKSGKQVALPGRAVNSTPTISEIYASTKPFPEWWSMLDDPHISQRRKSLGDNILERNVCFVDTPGYRNGASVSNCDKPHLLLENADHYIGHGYHYTLYRIYRVSFEQTGLRFSKRF